MSNDESVNEASSSSPSKPTKLSEDEAFASLEDHRCAICDSILINACRVDCGHTFCRHCLNSDRGNRNNERGKPTCFICDAAITEICQNPERDKEIDKLYASLPVSTQLSRARAKAERKAEEESFASRPPREREASRGRGNNSSNTPDSHNVSGTADGDYTGHNHNSNNNNNDDQGACWRERIHHDHHDVYGENFSNEESSAPIFYCVSSHPCCWHEEDMCDEFCTCYENRDENFQDPSVIDLESSEYLHNSSYLHSPTPIVIHHTVQHVFHTMEVHEGDPDGDNLHQEGEPESFDWSGTSEQCCYHSPRFRDHPSYRSTMPFSNYNCSPFRHQGCQQAFSCEGYYGQGAYRLPILSYPQYPENLYGYHRTTAQPYCENLLHHPTIYGVDTSSNRFSHFPPDCRNSQASSSSSRNGEGNEEQDENMERSCSAGESLCDFHRAIALQQEQRDLEETLSTQSRPLGYDHDLAEGNNTDGEGETDFENDNTDFLGREIFSINLSRQRTNQYHTCPMSSVDENSTDIRG